MKCRDAISISRILSSAIGYGIVSVCVAADPPTVDKTYRSDVTGTPFAAMTEPDDKWMKHLAVLPTMATAMSGKDNIAGLETIAGGGAQLVKLSPSAAGEVAILVDFGEEIAGRVQICGTPGGRLTITTGESAEECVRAEPHLDNSGPFKPQLTGDEPYSTPYSAFRYVRISLRDHQPVELTKIVCDHKYYPVKYRGNFSCSDPLLTRVWYTGAYTAHLCMQEEIWDAPKRDRGLWIGDLEVTGQTISNVFADRSLMEKSISKVRLEAQGKRAATELPETDVNTLPGYSASWFCTLADFYRHSGDREFLLQQHDLIVSLLKLQQTEFDSNNLFYNPRKAWDFCDWSPGMVTDSPLARATTNLYIIRGVHQAVYLLREMGDTKNADEYAAWCDRLTAAAREHLLDEKTLTYGSRLQENVMAVLSDTANKNECDKIFSDVLRANSPAWTMFHKNSSGGDDAMTPYYGNFLLQSLAKIDQTQEGLDLIRRYWGDMLKRGATTWWEMFDPAWAPDMDSALNHTIYISLSHGWSTGPTSYLTENILGVRPTGPGFSTVTITPKLGDLTWVQGDVPTPNGIIHVRVDKAADGLHAEITLPAHVIATVQLGERTVVVNEAGTVKVSSN